MEFKKQGEQPSEPCSSIANNPDFIRLVQLINEDSEFSKMVLGVINLETFHRQSMMNSIISSAKLKGAPEEHIKTLMLLMDHDVCKKIKEVTK